MIIPAKPPSDDPKKVFFITDVCVGTGDCVLDKLVVLLLGFDQQQENDATKNHKKQINP